MRLRRGAERIMRCAVIPGSEEKQSGSCVEQALSRSVFWLLSAWLLSPSHPARCGGTVAAESCVDSYSGVPAPVSHRLPDSPMPTRHGRLSTGITIAHSARACQACTSFFLLQR